MQSCLSSFRGAPDTTIVQNSGNVSQIRTFPLFTFAKGIHISGVVSRLNYLTILFHAIGGTIETGFYHATAHSVRPGRRSTDLQKHGSQFNF